ncbi:MAG: phage major capsid protein [Thermodesulfobacteriota bacterium]
MSILSELREQRNAKADQARKLQADYAGKITPALDSQINALLDEVDKLDNQIATEQRRTAAMPDPAGRMGGGFAPSGGPYNSLGRQLQDVARAQITGRTPDELLTVMDATGANEAVGSDGGYLVQSDFNTSLLRAAQETGILAQRCNRFTVSPGSNALNLPMVDETSRATGSRLGGVQVYRVAEAAAITASRPKFKNLALQLEKMAGLVYVTEELLQDSQVLEQFIRQAFAREFGFKLDDEIINGTGVGECLGVLNSPALIAVAKESGQAADTLVWENIKAMWSRMPARNRANACWYVNQEIEPQLFSMHMPIGTGGVPVFLPAGQASAAPYATLFTRPVVPIEQASALGDLGDIMLLDLWEYILGEKGGMQADASIHVKFVEAEMAFRFILRNNGMPAWSSPLTPYKGRAGYTLSPFVALAER